MQDRRFSPLLLILIVVVAVGMALVGFFWLGGPSAQPHSDPSISITKQAPPKTAPSPVIKPTTPSPTRDGPTPVAPVVNTPPAVTSVEQQAREAADMKIGTLLAQNPTVEGARDKLLLLFPTFTPFEKIAAAPHINNLTGDDKLRTVVEFLKNPNTPAEAQETFFNDMLNRPPQIGWPVLIEVIATPNHPLAARAKELLTTIVGQDYGNDVFNWQRGLRDQLKLQGAITDDPPTASTAPSPQP